jgi:RHS repeat-associated protein
VETALDFFQARYHANQQGRFLSVDPGQAGADLTSPQSWNGYGYGYGLNSPLVNTDPDVALHLNRIFRTFGAAVEDGNLTRSIS